jgi:hypothetical protein
VGGDHYAGQYQHWDFTREVLGNHYLRGNATKYLSRWRKKNGLEDLNKALHYMEKARETHVDAVNDWRGPGSFMMFALLRFAEANELTYREVRIILLVLDAAWEKAVHETRKLIEDNTPCPAAVMPELKDPMIILNAEEAEMLYSGTLPPAAEILRRRAKPRVILDPDQ